MGGRRVLAVGLDGYDLALAESMMAEGLLPNMQRLRSRSARFLLDHGRDRYTTLGWEQVSTGLTPATGGRWSPVTFDRSTYGVSQEPTGRAPFLEDLAAPVVVFDLPHCDLSRARRVRGVTNWGTHDGGTVQMANPDGLRGELAARVGPYPAEKYLYGMLWQSPEKTRLAADALARAVGVRAEAARWLLRERLPDWALAVVVVSEAHSAIEPMWHGLDAGHPLHGLPSAAPAREGVRRVYGAIDDLLGTLQAACPDATLVLFALHGMGTNSADVPSMVLLGELLYRHHFGAPFLRERPWKAYTAEGVPLLTEKQDWHVELTTRMRTIAPATCNLDWMPVARYRRFWPQMRAFALPAYFDGRIRINLRGREAQGVVAPADYPAVRDELAALLQACREPIRGESAVARVDFPDRPPSELGPTEADLYVLWRGAPVGLVHPALGTVGPFPYRRTGGHTGGLGFAYLAGEGSVPGDHGTGAVIDIVPTLADLLGEPRPAGVSGNSLLARAAGSPAFGPGGAP